jgi:hypothetical protein
MQRKITILAVALAAMLWGGAALGAQFSLSEVISLKPGEQQQREFYLYDVFTLSALQPAVNFLLIAAGTADAPAGTLTVKLEARPKLDFGARVTYSLTGAGYSLGEGLGLINAKATTPYTVQTDTDINASFGFALVGALIQGYVGGLEWPVPMRITFALSAGAVE